MAIGTDRYASRADTLLFLACVGLSIAAISLPDQWRDPLAQGLRQSVLAPLLFLQRQTELLAAARYRYDAVVAQRGAPRGGRPEGLAARAAGRAVPPAGPAGHGDRHLGTRRRVPARHSDRHRDRAGRRGEGMGAHVSGPSRNSSGRALSRDDSDD